MTNRLVRTLFATALLATFGSTAQAATITIVVQDAAGEGFNDPTPVAKDGTNPGQTLGAQRLALFEEAAKTWADTLVSDVTIKVGAKFDVLTPCTSSGGVLGSAGPNGVLRDFTGAPKTNTWYPVALAEAIRGTNLNGTDVEITARFNTDVDDGCLGSGTRFWYGFEPDGSGATVDLFPVVLHELGHGLGFLTLACTTPSGCGSSPFGSLIENRPDAWTHFMRDDQTGESWLTMTNGERAASMTNDPDLVWTGANVTAAIPTFQPEGGGVENGRMRLHAPSTIVAGSSVSHWSEDASDPNLLMEPALGGGVFGDVDMTSALFRDIGWTISAGGGGVPVNDPPVLTRPASYTVVEDTPRPIAGISVADPDAGTTSLTLTFSVPSGDIDAAFCSGVTIGGSGASRVLTGSRISLNNCVSSNTLIYTPVANATSPLTLTVVANDNGNTGSGGPKTDTESVPLTFTPVNDGPTLAAPATLAAVANVAKPLAMTLGDIDAGGNALKLTLIANAGSFSAPACSGVVASGANSIRSFEGTVAALTNCIVSNAITYTASTNAAGDTIQLTLDDQGNTGGGALTASDTITVSVTGGSLLFRNGFE